MPAVFLFHVLHEEAPAALADLHSRADDADAVRAWAVDWQLNSPSIYDVARILRHNWAVKPQSAPPMRPFGESTYTTEWHVHTESFENRWCESITRGPDGRAATSEALPNWHRETLKQWLQRARRMYYARAEATFAAPRNGRPLSRDRVAQIVRDHHRFERNHDDQFFRWFVRIQVLGTRPSVIAKRERVDRKAVERGSAQIASRL